MIRPDSASSGQEPPQEEKVITEILRSRLSQQGPWWNRRFPALLGLAVMLVGLVVTVFLTLKQWQARIQAAQPLVPQGTRITNLSSSSLTISWITSQATNGFVSYGQGPALGRTVLDDRDDRSQDPGLHYAHQVTLTGLSPEIDYFFKIGSGEKIFDDEGAPFQVKTAPLIHESPVFDSAFGQVFRADGSPAEGAIVYLTIPACSPLSTLVKASGSWLIAKNLALKEDQSSFCQYPRQGGAYNLFIQGGAGEQSRIDLLSGLDKPVPDITLGQNYSFKDLSALTPLGITQPLSTIAPSPASSPQQTPHLFLSGDLNHDGVVNTWDLAILKSNFGDSPQQREADLNQDGVVDEQDLNLLLESFDQ